MASTSVDVEGLKRLTRSMRQWDKTFGKRLTAAVRVAAAPMVADAKRRADFSSRIPGTVRLTGQGQRAALTAGGTKAPHAGTFEEGKRHPTFGHDPWVTQSAKPFLMPAAVAGRDAFAEQLADVLVNVITNT